MAVELIKNFVSVIICGSIGLSVFRSFESSILVKMPNLVIQTGITKKPRTAFAYGCNSDQL